MDNAFKLIYSKELVGFADKVFDFKAKVDKNEFIMTILTSEFCFLQPHRLRSMVMTNLLKEF